MGEILQPIINDIANFDAKKEYVVEFSYYGSDRVLTSEVSVRENAKDSLPVFTQTVSKFSKSLIIPAGALQNGKNYLIKIRVQENDKDWTEWSAEAKFMCLADPVFTFTSLRDGKYVYNNEVMMTVLYRQEQGEKVLNYQFVLMDQNKVPITKYPVRYPDSTAPNILQEKMDGFVKGRLYYVGCRVNTKNGISFFDKHEFVPHFVAPALAGIVNVQNQEEQGQVLLQAFLKQVLGTQVQASVVGQDDNTPANYIYLDNEWVVIPKDKPLMYKKLGMAKASDWIGKIWCKNVANGDFLTITKEGGDFFGGMKFVKHDDYITCEKDYLGMKYRTKSNEVKGLKKQAFYLYIKVIEFRVELHIEKI